MIAAGAAGGSSAVIAGMALKTLGGLAEATAARQQAEYQASVAENNANLMIQQAQDARERGKQQKTELQKRMAKLRGTGQTQYAAGNVRLGSGSPLDWEIDISEAEAIDINTIDTNTAREIWGFENQAANFKNKASALRSSGKAAFKRGVIKTGTSLLSDAGQFGTDFG